MKSVLNIVWLRLVLGVVGWYAGVLEALEGEERRVRVAVGAARAQVEGSRARLGGLRARGRPEREGAGSPAAERPSAPLDPESLGVEEDWLLGVSEADVERLCAQEDQPALGEHKALRERMHAGIRAAVARNRHVA